MLTKERIAALATGLALPVGLGERVQMIMHAFRAAAELDQLPDLLAALRAEADRWDTRYRGWAAEYPASTPIWAEWRSRVAATLDLLGEMLVVMREAEVSMPSAQEALPAELGDQPEYRD